LQAANSPGFHLDTLEREFPWHGVQEFFTAPLPRTNILGPWKLRGTVRLPYRHAILR
jgi:hypothetical protein